MAKIKTKKTHVAKPADTCNSADKVIMQTMEKHLTKIPEKVETLPEHLKIPHGYCTYCTVEGDKTIDEIFPCKNGGRINHLNMVRSCNKCNQSKSGRFWGGEGANDLEEWINNGPKCRKESMVPLKNRMKMINWIEVNTKKGYLKTDDPKIIKKIKNVKEIVTCFLQSLYEYCETDDYDSSEEMCFLQNLREYCETDDYDTSDRENTHVKITHGVSSEFCGEHERFRY